MSLVYSELSLELFRGGLKEQQKVLSLADMALSKRNLFDWWDWDFPSRIGEQRYGMGLRLDDLPLSPTRHQQGYYMRPRRQLSTRGGGHSQVKNEPDKFQIALDVSHFVPEEIEVKTVDQSVLVSAKHEERTDEHGFVSRQFTRRYILPPEVEPESVTSSLSPDGVLVIEAPKKGEELTKENARLVPIQMRDNTL